MLIQTKKQKPSQWKLTSCIRNKVQQVKKEVRLLLPRQKNTSHPQCDAAHECANAATRGTWIMEAAKEQLRQRIPSSCALLTWPKNIQRNIDNTVRKEGKELVGKVWNVSINKCLFILQVLLAKIYFHNDKLKLRMFLYTNVYQFLAELQPTLNVSTNMEMLTVSIPVVTWRCKKLSLYNNNQEWLQRRGDSWSGGVLLAGIKGPRGRSSLTFQTTLGSLWGNFMSEIATEVPGFGKEFQRKGLALRKNYQELFQVSWNASLTPKVGKCSEWISKWYFFVECYCQAMNPIVNVLQCLPLTFFIEPRASTGPFRDPNGTFRSLQQ